MEPHELKSLLLLSIVQICDNNIIMITPFIIILLLL